MFARFYLFTFLHFVHFLLIRYNVVIHCWSRRPVLVTFSHQHILLLILSANLFSIVYFILHCRLYQYTEMLLQLVAI